MNTTFVASIWFVLACLFVLLGIGGAEVWQAFTF